jgi:predicted RND superfamily exporter protein
MQPGFIEKFVESLIKWPVRYIIFSIILIILIGLGVGKLETNFTYRVWFEDDDPKLKVFDTFEKRFGSDELSVITIHSPSGVFDKETINLISELTEDIWKTAEVIRVDSLTNFNWVHAEEDEVVIEPLIPENDDTETITEEILAERKYIALNHPNVKGFLVNEKADVTVIYAKLKPSFDGSPVYENIVQSIREKLTKYEGKGDHTFYLSGNPSLNFAFKESTETDLKNLVPFVLLVTTVFLVFSFKNLTALILTFLIIGVTVLTTLGSGGWAGIQINNITSVVPQFMIAISISVVVHILMSFLIFYNKGLDKISAIKTTAIKNFIPTLLTAVTTAVGFASFATSIIPPIAGMGEMSSMGTMFSWLFTYTLIIPLIVLLPMKQLKGNPEVDDSVFKATARSIRVTEIIYRLRIPIFGFSTFLSVFCIYWMLKVEVNSDPFKYFDDKYPLSIATDFIEKHLGGAVGSEIVIESGSPEGIKNPEFLKKVEVFQSWLGKQSFVTKTISVVDILKDMNRNLNGGNPEEYKLPETQDMIAQQLFLYTMNLPQGMDINDRVTLENDAIRLTAMWTVHDSKTALALVKTFEDKAKELGLNAYVTGKMPLYQSINDKIVKSFQYSIILAVFFVGLLMIWGMKSLKIGLFSMIPNTLPLIFGAGFVGLLGQPLDIGTVIVGSICLGIAVDDTIHFLFTFNKFIPYSKNAKEAVAKVLSTTAPAMITTTVVIVSAFGTFMFATFVPNQNFGIFTSIILTLALFLDLIFVPALLMTVNLSPKNKTNDHRLS